MSRLLVALVVLFLAVAVSALNVQRVHLDRSEPIAVPAGWRRVSTTPVNERSSRNLKLVIAVKQRNLDRLDEIFWAVSDPKNSRYGKHLNQEQMAELVGAKPETLAELYIWLRMGGAKNIEVGTGRDYIRATISTRAAAKLFNINYHTYRHQSGVTVDASLGPYSIPAVIAKKIDLVTGLVGFPDTRKQPKTFTGLPSPNEIDPVVIRARYNISSDLVCTNPFNSHAVAEFQSQFYSPTDLQTFWTKFVPFAPFRPVDNVVGTNNPNRPGIEASLDVEYIMGVAPNCTTSFYSMASFNFYDDLMNWAAELLNETNPPLVHSVSYGSQGNYPTVDYMERLNTDFQKLGARGVSILFASGDSGAGCEGDPRNSTCDCTFFPSFPATCPYITSVGATRFLNGNSGPEGAVQKFKSGGGFSQDGFSTPSYQYSAVEGYLHSGVHMPESCAFNASGRATPDVAALGDEYFQVVNGGRTISVGGTSASSPTFAAVVTLLNDIRLNNGESSLGFLNPFLYQVADSTPSSFFDVTVGDNFNSVCCKSGNEDGFQCAPGWDPVTGLGTPNFDSLKNLV